MERENSGPLTAMTLTVRLTDELGRLLRDRASRDGQAPEEYVVRLIERDTAGPCPGTPLDASGIQMMQGAAVSDAEFEQLLGELASGPQLPHLSAGFSRADVYADHD